MSLTLRELREWAPEIDDLAKSAREAAANHTNSADFYRSLIKVSAWEGQGADAAQAAMEATARDHDALAENIGKAATRMEHVGQDAETVAETIKGILDDAAAQPVVQINETTNQVISPDTSFMTDEYAAEVAAKVADLRTRVAAALVDGERVDADLAGAITAAAGSKPAAKKPSSLEDLMLPGNGEPRAPTPGESQPGPDSLDSALDQLTGKPSHPGEPTPDAAGGAAAPVRFDPANIEQFKTMARQELQRVGVPADQIESRLDAMVAAAQQPLKPYTAPERDKMPPPGFADGFADRWFDTEQMLKELTGQEGFDNLKDSWTELAQGAQQTLSDPVGTVAAEVKAAIDNPAYYAGGKAFDLGAAAATAPFGGEIAAAGRLAALDDLATPGAIPHDLIDNATVHPSLPTASIEHSGASGDFSGSPGGHGAPGGNPMPFDVDSPLHTARPEFTFANPLDHMSPELQSLSEQHLTGSGETVLGPYAPPNGGPSYIEVAEHTGASYFDIGDAWNTSTPTQQLAANQHVLDTAITNRDTIKLSVPYYEIRPDTYTGAELRYIQEHGYQRIDDTTFVPPSKGR